MSIQFRLDGLKYEVRFIEFSDGASSAKIGGLPQDGCSGEVSITVNPTTPADRVLLEIMAVTDAYMSSGVTPTSTTLTLFYLPYGRADRQFEHGNGEPLRLFVMLLGLLKLDKIVVYDPHNVKALNKCFKQYSPHTQLFIISQSVVFKNSNLIRTNEEVVIVAPDKGAKEKALAIASMYINATIIYTNKTRDVSTGKITSIKVDHEGLVTGKRCVIVDDICDGGGTFLPIADQLKEAGAGTVELYVTHGIFSKGLNIFRGKYDKIHAYQTVGTFINRTDIMNFNEGLEVK